MTSIDPKESAARYESAAQFVADRLIDLVRDVRRHRQTALIDDGPLRELRDLLTPLGGSPMQLAESMVEDAAMDRLLQIHDAAAEGRGVLTARLRSAGDRRSRFPNNPSSEQDLRDGALMLEAAAALQRTDALRAAASCQAPTGRLRTTDPMEQIVESALKEAKIDYLTDEGGQNPCNLDFYLAAHDVHVEVKRMHSDRIADQMSRAENVIAAQGEGAVRLLADLIRAREKLPPEKA